MNVVCHIQPQDCINVITYIYTGNNIYCVIHKINDYIILMLYWQTNKYNKIIPYEPNIYLSSATPRIIYLLVSLNNYRKSGSAFYFYQYVLIFLIIHIRHPLLSFASAAQIAQKLLDNVIMWCAWPAIICSINYCDKN